MIDTTEYYEERERLRAYMANQIARLSLDTSNRGDCVNRARALYVDERKFKFTTARIAWSVAYQQARIERREQDERNWCFLKAWMPGFVRTILEPNKADELLRAHPIDAVITRMCAPKWEGL